MFPFSDGINLALDKPRAHSSWDEPDWAGLSINESVHGHRSYRHTSARACVRLLAYKSLATPDEHASPFVPY